MSQIPALPALPKYAYCSQIVGLVARALLLPTGAVGKSMLSLPAPVGESLVSILEYKKLALAD